MELFRCWLHTTYICLHDAITVYLPCLMQFHTSITFLKVGVSIYIFVLYTVHFVVVVCGSVLFMYIACSEGYGAFCRAVKMLFLEVVSVLCFGQGSYEPPTPQLIEVLMKQIFKAEQVTQDLTPLAWEEADSNPVVRSVLLQLILMGRCVALYSYCNCLNTSCFCILATVY